MSGPCRKILPTPTTNKNSALPVPRCRLLNSHVITERISLLVLLQAVEGILETILPGDTEMALRYKDCHLIVLRGFQDPRGYGPLWTARQVIK